MKTPRRKNYPLEKPKRLSSSLLWKLQRNYFEQRGIQAWSTGDVPHQITSNPFIADAYAKVVFGFLRDCTAGPLDLSQPVHIVELGSGAGRLAYAFLKRFFAMQRDSVLKDIPVKFVMTDFAEQNLAYWRNHSRLRPFVDQGLLDFALFDVERDTRAFESLRNPLVVIANYLFDSIPQDAFIVRKGQLYETLISLASNRKERDAEDPEILSRAKLSCHHKAVNGNYYRDREWNRILREYKQRLSGVEFLFPTGALYCVRNFHRLSRGRMLFLSADKGNNCDEALLQGEGVPKITLHGSFSMMVDYQILGDYCRRLGGAVCQPSRRTQGLHISAFMFGASSETFIETRQAYAEAIDRFGPDDFFSVKSGMDQVYESLSLEQIISFLRLSGWDHRRFWMCLPALKNKLELISDEEKQELYEAVRQVWDSYLPIGEAEDLPFELGTLLLEMAFYTEALEFLQQSVDLYGMAPGTAYNISLCYCSLARPEQALAYVDKALEMEAKFADAATLRRKLRSLLSRTSTRTRKRRLR